MALGARFFPWNDLPGQCSSSRPQPLPVVGSLSVWFLPWQPWENGQMKNRLIRRGIIVVALLATLPGMPVVAAYERGDYATAIRGFRKAADQGNAASQVNLGHAYAEGRGAPQDYQEALKWYRKAAEQGYVPAQVHLALCTSKAGLYRRTTRSPQSGSARPPIKETPLASSTSGTCTT